jgi:photosystem II stability/assembly factor-like uncharacterized protein/predicted esterase
VRKRSLTLLSLFAISCGDASPTIGLDSQTVPDASIEDASSADAGSCPSSDGCAEVDAGQTHGCSGGPGTFHDQTIEVDGEVRYYLLHVPDSYRCERAVPLWIDFHGTAGDRPEEAYRTQELIEVADREGVIVVRPRSRSSDSPFGPVYRWDQNPGDIERNVRFTGALIEELAELYWLDPDRRYASGFSSGANMAAQFLGSDRSEVRGVAMVGGGYWMDPAIGDLFGSDLRVYAVTGYRDYLIGTLLPLLAELEESGLGSDRIFFREVDAGHELYGWHFEEIWRWLDRGERPEDRPLSARWAVDTTFASEETLIGLEVTHAGELLATDRTGAIHRWWNGAWEEVGRASEPLTGICVLESGFGIAVGAGAVAITDDAGATWHAAPPAPELFGQYFGYAYLNDVACFGAESMVAAGYWSGVRSDDRASTYRGAELSLGGFDVPAQVAAIEVSSSSTAVAAGYFYLGRSDGAEQFTDVGIPGAVDWMNDVASAPGGRWWVAGEAGTIARSTDDGFSWEVQTTPIVEDLYAIDFFDENVGIAAGVHGAALYTEDGGETWIDASIGFDRFIGDVRWVDASTAIAVGERGLVLHFAR